jgi:hypothetical protein
MPGIHAPIDRARRNAEERCCFLDSQKLDPKNIIHLMFLTQYYIFAIQAQGERNHVHGSLSGVAC